MEQLPPQPPSDAENDAKIIPFKRPETPLDESVRRHPAHGRETPQKTADRVGLDDEPDDPDTA